MPAKLSDFTVIDTIGSGSFGICKRVRRKEDGRYLVWKELDYGAMSPREKEMLVSEVNILRDLRHPNIVRYYDRIIDRDNTKIYIVMEYCAGGDAGVMIRRAKRERRHIEESLIWKMFAQILWAVQDCHTKNGGAVLHRDLKPANIFLDRHGNVKIGDFGLARVLSNTHSYAKTFVGTPYYMSPEQLNEVKYNEKSDIWSLGCLIYELAALVPPFDASNQQELRLRVNTGMFKKLPSCYSEDLNTTIKLMLQRDSSQRPSTEDLLARGIAKGRISLSDKPQIRRKSHIQSGEHDATDAKQHRHAAAAPTSQSSTQHARGGPSVAAPSAEPRHRSDAPHPAKGDRADHKGDALRRESDAARRESDARPEHRDRSERQPHSAAALPGAATLRPAATTTIRPSSGAPCVVQDSRRPTTARSGDASTTMGATSTLQLQAREEAVRARETAAADREKELEKREAALLARERRIVEQERALDKAAAAQNHNHGHGHTHTHVHTPREKVYAHHPHNHHPINRRAGRPLATLNRPNTFDRRA